VRLAAIGACLFFPILTAASPPALASDAFAGMSTPCGALDFRPIRAPRHVGSTIEETIAVPLTFADGHSEIAIFPYVWVYRDGERTDPWSNTNLRQRDFAVALQLPPRGTDTSAFPALIRFVLDHTDRNGYARMPNCPRSGPPWRWPDAAGMTFIDDSPADSPVEILDPRLYEIGCIGFRNRTAQSLTIVHFTLTNVDAAGQAQPAERIDRFGSFAPGVLIEGMPRGMSWGRSSNNMLRNCRWNYPWTSAFRAIRIGVTGATFADGSTWSPGSGTAAPPKP
jgi:hypothetical protein